MGDNTKIEWADATLNYANGCSVLSPGCTNCYAMKQAHRFPVRQGLTVKTKGGMVWTGEVRINDKALHQALAWKRGRRIFWNAHGDLFHEKVTDAQIDRVFAVCALTPQHRHMILTKRSARMREYLEELDKFCDGGRGRAASNARLLANTLGAKCPTPLEKFPLPNVWLGVSVEDQARADERIPDLLATHAAVRFISAEPLLGPVDLTMIVASKPGQLPIELDAVRGEATVGAIEGVGGYSGPAQRIDWVIAGGESGPGARPMHPDWARGLRDQCAAAGVAFHFKQWGEWRPDLLDDPVTFNTGKGRAQKTPAFLMKHDGTVHCFVPADEPMAPVVLKVGKKRAGRLLDGVTHDGFPS